MFAFDGPEGSGWRIRGFMLAAEPIKPPLFVGLDRGQRGPVDVGFNVDVEAFHTDALARVAHELPSDMEGFPDDQHGNFKPLRVDVSRVGVVERTEFIDDYRGGVFTLRNNRNHQQP